MRGAVATYWLDLQRGAPPAPRPRGGRALTALTALLVLLALLVAGTRVAGLEPLTVLSGSMRPAIAEGDLVLVRRTTAATMRPGQVVTFAAPGRAGRTLTHRVQSVRATSDDRVDVVTKGDANLVPERWSIAPAGRIARVEAVLPKLGYLAHPFSAGWSRGVALALITLAAAGTALWLIWRPREDA
jgi:signal peptidase I